ncbi:MAG: energy transducer TonB [Rhizomicrobium sp.]
MLVGLAIGGAGPMDQPNDIPLLSYNSLPPGVTYPTRIGPLPRTYYPALAVRCGLSGTATVELLVNADGSVGSAKITSSSGYTVLDAATLDQANQFRYSPATKDGVPMPARIDIHQKWIGPRYHEHCTLPASALTNGAPRSPDEIGTPTPEN